MTLEELRRYIAEQYGIEPEYLFKRYPDIAVFRRPDSGKWFALTGVLERRKLGIAEDGRVEIVNLKLDPLIVEMLRSREGFRPAWHMNRERWITVLLDGPIEAEELHTFLDMSYGNVAPRVKARR